MKKLLFLLLLNIIVSFGLTAQNSGCWTPATASHCAWMTSQLDDNTTDKHAVYQANVQCVYIKYDFDFWPPNSNNLLGLKLFIHGGGVFDIVTLYDYCALGGPYSWNQLIPSPFFPDNGVYIYSSNQIVDPSAVKVTFIYSEVDWLACEYEGLKFKDYFGFNGPLCAPPSSFQNENDDDFGGINISFKEKTTGLNPTVVRDYINITMEEEITSVKVIDINGRQVKQYDNTGFMRSRYDLSSLIPGMYIVRIVTSDDLIKNYKIVKE